MRATSHSRFRKVKKRKALLLKYQQVHINSGVILLWVEDMVFLGGNKFWKTKTKADMKFGTEKTNFTIA